ncbi:Multicopper oxidase type 2 [Penicillium cf. griseofulvum]|nr:Multicopper oxidase type 2 [Penicillium cf. griseofulvum]
MKRKSLLYELTVSNQVISPDGYLTDGMVVNGQYPGPTIEANWGDTLRVTVHNNLTNDNGTAMHWHGIRQSMTNWLDGVPGVTQCPSKPGSSQVYEFRLMQYGTSWYHSHFSIQYTNGVYGAIKINGPSSMDYDVDLGPILMSDWYHADAFGLYPIEILTPHAPMPSSDVMNGKGVFDCDPSKDPRCTGKHERHEIVFKKGTTYKLGLVNAGSLVTYKFWIDGHKFTVIQNDFVPIEPYETDVLIVGIGQRYEILIEADAEFTNGTNFWMHANYCDIDTWESRLGIIRYDALDTSDPYTPPVSEQHYGFGCQDPQPESLVPIVKRHVGQNVNSFDTPDYLRIGLQAWPNVSDPNSRIHTWLLTNRSIYLDWTDPSIKKLTLDANSEFPPDTTPITLDFETGDWVYFLILNNYTLSDAATPRTIPRSVHPIHLHGHDYVILAQGEGPFPEDLVPNLDNPARRDVANCPIGGYLWIAFQINNPGAWLMHCHIAWHASTGLGLQFLEQPSQIKPMMQKAGVLPELADRCNEWTDWYNNHNIPNNTTQEDSGI